MAENAAREELEKKKEQKTAGETATARTANASADECLAGLSAAREAFEGNLRQALEKHRNVLDSSAALNDKQDGQDARKYILETVVIFFFLSLLFSTCRNSH